jgi:diguanylate cyclase (GGDEF)-like protein
MRGASPAMLRGSAARFRARADCRILLPEHVPDSFPNGANGAHPKPIPARLPCIPRNSKLCDCSPQAASFDPYLDHFKALNDRWGHPVGDRALRHFARLLLAETGTNGIVGRVGGEEFAIVLPGADPDQALAFAQRVQQRAMQARLTHEDQQVTLTVSIGIDAMRASDFGAYQPLSRADKALYLAKERGRNRIEVFRG